MSLALYIYSVGSDVLDAKSPRDSNISIEGKKIIIMLECHLQSRENFTCLFKNLILGQLPLSVCNPDSLFIL